MRTPKVIAAVLANIALASCATTKLSPTRDDVMVELSRRSSLSRAQLAQHLAHCESDEQSRFLCASRARVEADLKLDLVTADKLRELPGCRLTLERKLWRFQQDREKKCGVPPETEAPMRASSELTQQMLCANQATQRMIKDVLHETRCRAR